MGFFQNTIILAKLFATSKPNIWQAITLMQKEESKTALKIARSETNPKAFGKTKEALKNEKIKMAKYRF